MRKLDGAGTAAGDDMLRSEDNTAGAEETRKNLARRSEAGFWGGGEKSPVPTPRPINCVFGAAARLVEF